MKLMLTYWLLTVALADQRILVTSLWSSTAACWSDSFESFSTLVLVAYFT